MSCSYHPHLPRERGTGGGEAEFKLRRIQIFCNRPHPNPSPGGEGLKNVNNIDNVITKSKNYIGQLSSPSPLGEGDRRG